FSRQSRSRKGGGVAGHPDGLIEGDRNARKPLLPGGGRRDKMMQVFQIVVLTFALGLVPVSLSACGWPSSGEPPSQQVAVANENAPLASEGNTVDEPAPAGRGNWGTVKGQTVWAGGPIPPLLLASTTGNKDEAFC